jgi:DNA-binding protein H-NS
MRRAELNRMDLDRLWALHEAISELLKEKLTQERQRLIDRLKRLERPAPGRRPDPRFRRKYRNPDNPTEIWAGRGRRPHWLARQLRLGRRMDDFRI